MAGLSAGNSHLDLGAEDAQLMSTEKMDRSSPEMWPEQMPGVSEFAALKPEDQSQLPAKSLSDNLDKDDLQFLQELGSLSQAQLLEKVRCLKNFAYSIGLDEAREMTRGRFLCILKKPNKK